jgi:fructose/tagatose bisphosphate aldolase
LIENLVVTAAVIKYLKDVDSQVEIDLGVCHGLVFNVTSDDLHEVPLEPSAWSFAKSNNFIVFDA